MKLTLTPDQLEKFRQETATPYTFKHQHCKGCGLNRSVRQFDAAESFCRICVKRGKNK